MLVIKDANIFIDLYEIDLLEYLAKLDMEVYITDFVAETEITESGQQKALKALINCNQIQVLTSTNQEIVEIMEISNQESNRLSIQDCSNLYFAKMMHATLLTNDNLLRSASKKHGVKVHGIIWLFDLWVDNKILTREIAAKKMIALWKINNWLPYEEMKKRIGEWSGGKFGI